ncbi:hypothetical protein HJFPF1_02972 [Paramyrothecium foliicola]|nr:hypothetical protein HJFPF1_02972 [Paramyrothecium foliicola]
MISSNTRASRSRFSSPANTRSGPWNGIDASKGSATDSSRTFMQKWLEPTVQTKTSFEEDGLVRYGVVENMAPLGTFPKPKKAGSNENGQPIRRIILRPSAANLQAKAEAEAKASALTQTLEQEANKAMSPPSSPPVPVSRKSHRRTSLPIPVKDAEDPEYNPNGDGTRRRQSGRVLLAKKARRSSGARRISVSSTAKRPATPVEPAEPPVEPVDKEFVDKVVGTAVDEALKHYRYPTAWALRTLYDEKSGDNDFVSMLEDVFSQTASTDTLGEFSRQVEEKKREGKKDNQGCYYFVPPTTNSRFTPHKPKAAPYAKLLQHDDDDEERAAKKMKTSHAGGTPRKPSLVGDASTPSRKRTRRHSASSNSSLSSAMSISSPEISFKKVTTPSRPRAAAVPAVVGAQTQPQTRSAKSSDAPKPRPITTRGKSKQAASNTSESVSPTQSNHTLTNTTNTTTTTTTASNTNNGNSTSSASSATIPSSSSGLASIRLAEAGMPGRLSSTDFIANLSVKSSKSSKDIPTKAHMPAEEDDAFWNRRRDAQKITNNYDARESSVRGRGRGRDDEEEEDPNATPVRKARRTRHSMLPSVATRATRSASRKPATDDGESIVSSMLNSPSQIEASSTVASRAVTPTSLRPPKRPKTGLRVKSS